MKLQHVGRLYLIIGCLALSLFSSSLLTGLKSTTFSSGYFLQQAFAVKFTGEKHTPGFCQQGTGGMNQPPCVPCDPGLGLGNCVDMGTGDVNALPQEGIFTKETADSSQGDNVKTGISELVKKEQLLQEVRAIKDPGKRVLAVIKDLEDQRKIPPNSVETVKSFLKRNPTLLSKFCNGVSTDKSDTVGIAGCNSLPTQPTGTGGTSAATGLDDILIGIVVQLVLKELDDGAFLGRLHKCIDINKDTGKDIDECMKGK